MFIEYIANRKKNKKIKHDGTTKNRISIRINLFEKGRKKERKKKGKESKQKRVKKKKKNAEAYSPVIRVKVKVEIGENWTFTLSTTPTHLQRYCRQNENQQRIESDEQLRAPDREINAKYSLCAYCRMRRERFFDTENRDGAHSEIRSKKKRKKKKKKEKGKKGGPEAARPHMVFEWLTRNIL